ncbi:uncharacterized protein LOC125217521 [Salvia hispanica]|uniref:uncharacterized protein LOC125217521 n=1 Tax=Salvia hispanica TaxID=49212 RepID=UPI002009AC3E|nr:uncharacterized protein LOC125217521 [Salvia hispanica]XP_047974993.1 uncharacterized protein LOC125217521 [Salvia hispanica]XP_047974995.1 uncharacterized protein LOC125217521 [Salvia hispanica]
MTILLKKRVHFLLFVIGVIALSITAEKCRQWVGKEAASKSGQFTFLNCFDGSSGTLACAVKECVKLYFYNIRSHHVENRRNEAIEAALADAVAQGMAAKDAAKVAQKEGAKAAKLATRKAKRIIGPIISSGWDFFEAVYYGGTVTEGFLRGTGTLFGTYYFGFIGEERFGRFGYLVGSHLGSWVGGRIGLMVYDVVNGIHYMMQFQQADTQGYEDSSNDKFFQPDDGKSIEAEDSYLQGSTFGGVSDEPNNIETPADEPSNNESPVDENFDSTQSSSSEEYNNSETPEDMSFDAHEEL